MDEIWKPVVGFEGQYEVSSLGGVRSYMQGKHAHLLKPGRAGNKGEYRSVRTQGRVVGVHVLVARAFIGPQPHGTEVSHKNGVASDNRADNLCYATPKENSAQKREHGTLLYGDDHPRSKLSSADIARIRATKGAVRQVDLAAEFGVSQTTISRVRIGRTWTHV